MNKVSSSIAIGLVLSAFFSTQDPNYTLGHPDGSATYNHRPPQTDSTLLPRIGRSLSAGLTGFGKALSGGSGQSGQSGVPQGGLSPMGMMFGGLGKH